MSINAAVRGMTIFVCSLSLRHLRLCAMSDTTIKPMPPSTINSIVTIRMNGSSANMR